MTAYSPSFALMICRSRCSSDATVNRYVSTTMAIAPMTNKVEYQSARRSPNARVNGLLGAKDISNPPHGMQQLLLERTIDFLAQSAHQDVNDVGLRIEVVFPDMRQDHRLRHNLAGVAHQVFEQPELARPELDCRVTARNPARQEVQHEI